MHYFFLYGFLSERLRFIMAEIGSKGITIEYSHAILTFLDGLKIWLYCAFILKSNRNLPLHKASLIFYYLLLFNYFIDVVFNVYTSLS